MFQLWPKIFLPHKEEWQPFEMLIKTQVMLFDNLRNSNIEKKMPPTGFITSQYQQRHIVKSNWEFSAWILLVPTDTQYILHLFKTRAYRQRRPLHTFLLGILPTWKIMSCNKALWICWKHSFCSCDTTRHTNHAGLQICI